MLSASASSSNKICFIIPCTIQIFQLQECHPMSKTIIYIFEDDCETTQAGWK